MAKPQEIRELAERLGEQRATLRQMEANVRRVQAGIQMLELRLEAIAPTSPTNAPGAAKTGDVAAKVLSLLEGAPEKEFGTPDVEKSLGEGTTPASVRAALSRLEREKRIVRVRRGVYAAKKGGEE